MTMRLHSHRILIWASLFGVTACAGQVGEPQIRAASSGSSAPLGSVDKGRFLLDQGQYGLAIDEFRKALRVDPDNVGSVEGLARSYDRLGRADLSDRYYQQALALSPRNRQLYGDYAASLRSHGRAQDAVNLEADLRMIEQPGPASAQGVLASAPLPMPTTPAKTPAPSISSATPEAPRASGPYLSRESLGVVRLVTQSPSAKGSNLVGLDRIAVPNARLRLPTRVVNAVGRRGIASRYIGALARNGWSHVEAGDAIFKLERSQVICPPERCAEAEKLAATLPFKVRAMPSDRVSRILVLLGKDALAADTKSRGAARG